MGFRTVLSSSSVGLGDILYPRLGDRDILDIDDESLTELIHQGMLKMLQGMHNERSPLDVVEIQDKFVNTLLTLAEHLNRMRDCRNKFVGSRKFKEVYGGHLCNRCEGARD